MTQKVSFVYSKRRKNVASVVMRSFQLCEMMKDRYSDLYDFDCICNYRRAKDSILIFGKHSISTLNPQICEALKRRNNKIILDYICEPPSDILRDHVNMYCASSRAQEHYYRFNNLPTHFVCHHADPRILKRFRGGDVQPVVKYIGNIQNTFIPDSLDIKTTLTNTSNQFDLSWMNELQMPFIYYILRKWMWYDGFKPFTKGVLASQINSVVIGQANTADNDYYLGDYPYMTSATPSDSEIIEVVNRTIESVKSRDTDFARARSVMRHIKESSMPEVITRQVYEMISLL